LFFKEPRKIENYILEETEEEELEPGESNSEEEKTVKKGKRRRNSSGKESEGSNGGKSPDKGIKISKKLEKNLEYMKKVYSIPINSDIIIREFSIAVKDKLVEAFAIYIDGLIDKKTVNESILKPLMLLSTYDSKINNKSIVDYVKDHLLPQAQVKETRIYEDVIDEVNFGGCGIFVDGADVAFVADVKGWEHRNVERPNIELIIRGPQEGFTEVLQTNTALVRKIIKDNNLVVESITIGKKSKTPCHMLYIKDIVNDSLVNQVRKRLKSIKVDYIIDSGELEQYLEDNTYLSVPQVIDTERPDKVAMFLEEGKVGILMNGTPIALVVPANIVELIKSPEDAYIRYPYSNFLRIIRLLGMIVTLLLPGLYIAITNYHHEMIPTELMFAIEAAREKVPFPSIIELLILEVSFELIREAGIRVPGPIGPTLGIIGALILGQAAVAANIVSPILIIIVAVAGIGSFAVPTFSFGFGIRISRFFYIVLGAMAGFLGIATGLFINGLWLAAAKSFGVPFLVPFAPMVGKAEYDFIIRKAIWKQEWRPDYLNVKRRKSQSHISRGWTKK
ncbi:MAG: spore germination protein, partial [Clostridiaceae bacterium]|nr:spore germination protein [Clostridiaceae bacterium]